MNASGLALSRRQGLAVAGRRLAWPSLILLLAWMVVPLAMTVFFSTQYYNLLYPDSHRFVGGQNFVYFFTYPSFWISVLNTLLLVGGALLITVVLGVGIAVLVDESFPGRGAVRLLLISPFFIMPTVAALLWKNLLMNPVSGVFAWMARALGLEPIHWFSDWPLLSILVIVAWEWLPFAILIFITALQSMDREQREAAELDGAGPWQVFWYLTLPHLKRSIAVVVMVEAMFLLNLFAEIYVTTNGGPGDATTNLPFLVYTQALLEFDVGAASAGGLVAVLLANVLALFLIRLIGRSLAVDTGGR